jgi:outer membrane protein OmpA-like peptidoglycan-associated protein
VFRRDVDDEARGSGGVCENVGSERGGRQDVNAIRTIVSIVGLTLAAGAAAVSAQEPATTSKTARPGEIVELSVSASDPDGDPLTYTWSASAGTVNGSGPRATFDTTGLAGSTSTVSVVVSDGKCEVTKNFVVAVEALTPPPEIARVGECSFAMRGAKVTNACKQLLDDAALRLQADPTVQLVVDGHSASGERAGVALKRAEGVRDYLVNERGINASRIVVRSFDDRCPAGTSSRETRVELFLVPEGRTASEIKNGCQ